MILVLPFIILLVTAAITAIAACLGDPNAREALPLVGILLALCAPGAATFLHGR